MRRKKGVLRVRLKFGGVVLLLGGWDGRLIFFVPMNSVGLGISSNRNPKIISINLFTNKHNGNNHQLLNCWRG